MSSSTMYQYNSLLVLDGSSSSSPDENNSSTNHHNTNPIIVKLLNDERNNILESGSTKRSGLAFEKLVVDEQIAQSVVDLFRAFTSVIMDQQRLPPSQSSSSSSSVQTSSSPMSQIMSKLVVRGCPSNHFLEYVLETALAMDIFREIHLEGLLDPTEEVQLGQQERVNATAAAANNNNNNNANGGNEQNDPDENDENENENDDDNDTTASSTPMKVPLALDTFGFRMRFVKRLKTIEIINLPLSHDDVQGLMYGMDTTSTSTSTSQGDYFDTGITKLSFDGVRFVLQHADNDEELDGDEEEEEDNEANSNNDDNNMVVIEELCDGLSNITTLQTLEMERCHLDDEQLNKIFHALKQDEQMMDNTNNSNRRRHRRRNLTSINVSGNHCRQLGLKAIDDLLLVPRSRTSKSESERSTTGGVESLNLSFQFTSDDASAMTYTEQMQLDILTDNWQQKINNRLIHLSLAGNQLHDSDMKHVGLLLHRFPSLQSLNLSFNEITVDGLNMLVTTVVESSRTKDDESANFKVNINVKPSSVDKSSRLRSLNLTNNPLTSENYASALLRLLKYLPELRSVESNVVWDTEEGDDMNNNNDVAKNKGADDNDRKCRIQNIRGKVQHLIDINTAGRVLLCNSRRRSIRLNVWPLVLARLARPSKKIYDPGYQPMKNQCNGMYYLLRHGPILAKPNAAANNYPSTNANQISKLGKRKRVDPALGDYETLDDFLKAEADVSI